MFAARLYEPESSTKSINASYQSFKNSIIDGADNIQNVCNIDIVIKDVLFQKKKIGNVCSIDLTPRISRGLTVCRLTV